LRSRNKVALDCSSARRQEPRPNTMPRSELQCSRLSCPVSPLAGRNPGSPAGPADDFAGDLDNSILDQARHNRNRGQRSLSHQNRPADRINADDRTGFPRFIRGRILRQRIMQGKDAIQDKRGCAVPPSGGTKWPRSFLPGEVLSCFCIRETFTSRKTRGVRTARSAHRLGYNRWYWPLAWFAEG